MMKNDIPTSRSVGTHDGTFHADEVSACALLLMADLIDRDKIFRTRDPAIIERCEYVCDVGGIYDPSQKLFDHHQADYQGPMSSAGMVLLYLKDTGKLSEKEYHYFNQNVILGVDAHDNGKDPQIPGYCTYSHIIANFTPIPYDVSPEFQDKAFFEAMDFALSHLKRLHQRFLFLESCRETVSEKMRSNEPCLIFEKSMPWLELFFEMGGKDHPAQFIIMPSGEHWKLRGIPPTFERKMEVRYPLPSSWAGLLEEDLKKVTGIPGAIFCHKGRFISVWETKEDALKALEFILGEQ